MHLDNSIADLICALREADVGAAVGRTRSPFDLAFAYARPEAARAFDNIERDVRENNPFEKIGGKNVRKSSGSHLNGEIIQVNQTNDEIRHVTR